jgi:hypothetical protein
VIGPREIGLGLREFPSRASVLFKPLGYVPEKEDCPLEVSGRGRRDALSKAFV